MVVFTVFYVYFAAKVINYFNKYRYLSLANMAFLTPAPLKNNDVRRGMEPFIPALEKWIGSKGYIALEKNSFTYKSNKNKVYLTLIPIKKITINVLVCSFWQINNNYE